MKGLWKIMHLIGGLLSLSQGTETQKYWKIHSRQWASEGQKIVAFKIYEDFKASGVNSLFFFFRKLRFIDTNSHCQHCWCVVDRKKNHLKYLNLSLVLYSILNCSVVSSYWRTLLDLYWNCPLVIGGYSGAC